MAAAMADLTQQSQELIKEVNRRRQQQHGGEQGQNSKEKKKKTRSICNENIDKFCCVKKIRYVFNENIDQFSVLEKSHLYLMKIQISFLC